jgi:HTH-type transcriptional regulator/antitoxin HigA
VSELRYEPDYAVPPGRTLRDTLAHTDMTQADLASRAGLSLKHVNQVVHGVAPISPETALLLEKVTGVHARMWTGLEASYREQLAREADRETLARDEGWLEQVPLKELQKAGHLSAGADKTKLLQELCRFFGVANRKRWEAVWLSPLASFRQSPSFASDAGAVATWLRIGELDAAMIDCKPFDAKAFRRVLTQVRGLTRIDPEEAADELQTRCAAVGVAVVFVAEIGKTRASGAARWLTPSKALIQLSLRYKRDDHLWFSFFHEAGHILLHSKKQTFVDQKGDEQTSMEEEANHFAATQLIPRRYEPELAQLDTEPKVVEFAERIGIAPGIVVGRLQKEELWGWQKGNHLKRSLKLIER